MHKKRQRGRISENRVTMSFGRKSKGVPKNGFRKTARTHNGEKGRSTPSEGANDTNGGVSSAIERIKKSNACYTHSGIGGTYPGSRNSPGVSAFRKGTRLYHKRKTLADTKNRWNETNDKWRTKVIDYARPLLSALESKDRKLLRGLLGLKAYAGAIRASDLAATRRFGLICIDVVHSYWLAASKLRWFHITLLDAESHISERRPALALKRLKAKAYKEVQELGLNGLGWIDVDPVPNYSQGGEGGTLLFHVHFLGFTDRDFNVAAARAKLAQSRSWSSDLKADPTDITEITPRMGTPAWWAYYGPKPPYRGKRRILSEDGTTKLKQCEYRPQLAMRMFEGFAQMARMDLFFGVGEGKDLREQVRRSLMAWHRKRWSDQRPIEVPLLVPFFRRLWGCTRVKRYKRWRLVGVTV
jgi:hypothetical protein